MSVLPRANHIVNNLVLIGEPIDETAMRLETEIDASLREYDGQSYDRCRSETAKLRCRTRACSMTSSRTILVRSLPIWKRTHLEISATPFTPLPQVQSSSLEAHCTSVLIKMSEPIYVN